MQESALSNPHPVNILLVDDQPAKLVSYEVVLSDLKENLFKAKAADEALQILLKNEIAIVLIDVCMPDLDGFELAGIIRNHPRYQNVAIIFISAIQISDLDRLRGYDLGAVDYVPVPVVPELLRAKVRVFADLYRKTRQLQALNEALEQRVAERTAELELANAELERRVEERTQERESALAQVHEMQKLESLGQLTGGVAHDFNNLLMVILGSLRLLKKRFAEDAKALRLIEGAIEGASRGANLTKRMLAFARRQELKPESVDVRRLVEGMKEMLCRTLGTTIQISTAFRDNLPAVRIDPNQLELALLNLALNARDSMPLGGRLGISAWAAASNRGPGDLTPGEYVCLVVEDSGSGMDHETLRRATEPFFTTKGAGRGTGLGLSMVHGLAAQSGGSMRISSKLGAGTSVELWLPACGAIANTPKQIAPAEAAASLRCRILLVDDDALTLTATSELLEDLGHSVIEAASGAAALDILHRGTPVDLVLTDHAMPVMTGMRLARQIAVERPELPIILATGYAEIPGEEDMNLPCLLKPYDQDQLRQAILAALGDKVSGKRVIPIDFARRA